MKQTINGYFRLLRPVNVLIAGLSIFLGGVLSGFSLPIVNLVLAVISGMLITGAANTINDVFDLEIDRINKPERPLPSNRLSINAARLYSGVLFIVGCLLGCCINWQAFFVAILTTVLLFAYSAWLKPTALWGNLTVGFVSGLAFIYGGIAVGRIKVALIVGVFACLFHIAREIIKDLEDVEGDGLAGAQTLPIKYGFKSAMIIATITMAAVIVATLLPLFTDCFTPIYYFIVIPGVDCFLIGVTWAMWKRPERSRFHMLAVLMKVDMLVGLMAVFFGRI
ncbi:geranylgeranylglycerol-phosphate geranylgeranyltransferase [bacterium]|nr:geranylgeranylglycerol-phosphate geranylgeranyltransferase [bacterium]